MAEIISKTEWTTEDRTKVTQLVDAIGW